MHVGQSSHNLLLSSARAICIGEIFIQLVKTSMRESWSDRRLHNGNINKPAICHLLSDYFFLPNNILKYKLVITYSVQNGQVPYDPSFYTNTSVSVWEKSSLTAKRRQYSRSHAHT